MWTKLEWVVWPLAVAVLLGAGVLYLLDAIAIA
jgi:hypothetical protein